MMRLVSGTSSCEISPERGATVTSWRVEGAGELLWSPPEGIARSGFPGGGIPTCVPWAGRVFVEGREGLWSHGGGIRPMPIHGFGASSAWEGAQDSSHAARFRLETREGEREEFPFASLFESRVALSGDALELRLKVTRAGRCGVEGLMPVACGWHPYFRLAAFGQEDLSRVKFACEARACLEVTPGGGAGSSSPRDWSKPISINDPYLGSRIIGDWHEGRCALGLERGPRLEMTFGPAPLVSYGVLWVKPERGFACVEPWMGLPDAVHTGMGVRWLRPGERFEMTMCLAWRAG